MRSYVNIQYNWKKERHLPHPFVPFHTYSTSALVQSIKALRHSLGEAIHTVVEGDNVIPYKSRETCNSNALFSILFDDNTIGESSGPTFVITLQS